jgi:hypothetical protein
MTVETHRKRVTKGNRGFNSPWKSMSGMVIL